LARNVDAGPAPSAQDNNFTLNGAHSVSGDGVDLRELLALCLAENERRFSGYDERLLRPLTVPRLVRFGLRVLQPFYRRPVPY